MRAFVDTSALLALLNGDDRFHQRALAIWDSLMLEAAGLMTSSYVALETNAIVQRRLGLDALRVLEDELLRGLDVHWVSKEVHVAGAAAQLAAGRRKLSLVDCTSFEVMRRLGLRQVFTFDRHFAEQGFVLLSPAE